MTPGLLADVVVAISAATGRQFVCKHYSIQGGGCINRGFALSAADGQRYFAKLNDVAHLDMFESEADALRELNAAGVIRVPQPIVSGCSGGEAYLILEWLPLSGRGSASDLGRQLAHLHRRSQSDFGWWRNNYIGSTPQLNTPLPEWVSFFRAQRLSPQFDLARRNNAPRSMLQQGARLLDVLDAFFPGYRPIPSLLHGDLWGGNHGYVDGVPVLFDPSAYYGDREVDLAMTDLFGGYPAAFYSAYQEEWPLDRGYPVRKTLYNLYHVLNHFNLFGGGYAAQAARMVDQLLAEVK